MKCNSRPKAALAVLLAISLLATGCTAQWISVALADLPVLLQMALNIGSLVTTLQSGQQLSASEAQAIQNISAESSKDLNLLQTLYNQYQANPTASALQKIQSTVADINQNLPALLQAAHIADPVLSARVGAAVNLILATVTSFAALIPQASGMPTGRMAAAGQIGKKATIPHPQDLKKQWNQTVCGATGKASLDATFSVCPLK
ncbi:MAG: hypothetical protein WBQ09_07530 [Terriglobales bacterium]|jgi:hypothetical protein